MQSFMQEYERHTPSFKSPKIPTKVLFWTVRRGPSGVQQSSRSVCSEMRRLDDHRGDAAESILNETGISEHSLY